jgi:AraC-like DNA-binding protein
MPSGDMDNVTGRQHEHYERFMQLLDRNFKNERKNRILCFRLCITPKYLSTLVKKLSGKTAAEWINGLIIMEAKHLLKYSGTTIQEVSEYLNFPNSRSFPSTSGEKPELPQAGTGGNPDHLFPAL